MTSEQFIASKLVLSSQHLAQCLLSLWSSEGLTVKVWRQVQGQTTRLVIESDDGCFDCGDERSLQSNLTALENESMPELTTLTAVTMAALPLSHLPMLMMQYNHFDHI
ncbi:hypothetical protein FJQ87_16245 [Shewanella sp. SNU WT4]|uniref:hypothetical protein n=1 Tax=Shewanella sp. SNU WT4 TaxID=2590015 RepID=UPI00112E545E|nr:hypothetical protein [Shewanella sp. SNU WT4]QDF68004.1 hypothetical protein FJQ87_16245 [Shewanella sp. SNU WT4]